MKRLLFVLILFFGQLNTCSSQSFNSLPPGFNFETRSLYYDSINSKLYAGGGFWQTGDGDPMWRISKWNGTDWDSLGHGLDGIVFTITKYNSEIYAGGWFVSSFDSVGTVFPGLGKWNETDWVRIENDSIHHCCVLSLLVHDNFLYVGGTFDTINSQPATGIAKYDGTNWFYFPPMPNATTFLFVSAIAIYNNELYVAGNFSGGAGLEDIMKFDGTNWVSVGGGLSGASSSVTDMEIFQNKLYIVGNLSAAAGDHGNGIAIWDGTTWSQAGSGLLPSTVLTLEEFQGELYVGGQIQSAGGIPVNNIAKWDGITWYNIGANFDNTVTCLAAKDSINLFIGGAFLKVNGDTVNRICEYNTLTGIIEISSGAHTHILPNPASNLINIQLNNGSINSIQIFSISGKLVLEQQGDESVSCELDVSLLANGIYVIKVFSEYGIYSEKLIIQKME